MRLVRARLPGQRAAQRRDPVGGGQRQAAQRLEEGIVVREGAVDQVHRHGRRGGIEAPPFLVTGQHGIAAGVEPGLAGLCHHIDQRADILEAEVQALSGQRVDPARRVAEQGGARARHLSGNLHHQRIGEGRPVQVHLACEARKARIQFRLDGVLRQFRQRLGGAGLHVPGEVGAVAGQRQRRKRAFRREQLAGDPVMRPAQGHVRGENRLSIRAPFGRNAEGLAHRRLDPVTGRDQPGPDHASIFKRDLGARWPRCHARKPGAA